MPINRSPPTTPVLPAPSNMDVVNTALQHCDSAPDLRSINVAERKKRKHEGEHNNITAIIQDMFTTFSSTYREQFLLLRQDMLAMKNELGEAISSLTSCHKRLDEIHLQLNSSEKRLKCLEQAEAENSELKMEVERLKDQLMVQNQMSLKNELEISGITETKGENPISLVLFTASKVGVDLSETDIEDAARVGPRRSISMSDADNGTRPYQRPLVVRFLRKAKRDEYYKAIKSRRNLNNGDIIVGGRDQKIFVNERLTKENRMLFRETRLKSRQAKFKYCWTRNGSIYVCKYEGGKAIHVRNWDDIDRLFRPLYPEEPVQI